MQIVSPQFVSYLRTSIVDAQLSVLMMPPTSEARRGEGRERQGENLTTNFEEVMKGLKVKI